MEVVQLIIPFIALALISVMSDRLTLVLEAVTKRIPKLPDAFEWWIAYLVVLAISYVVCSEGSYDLFLYLHLTFAKPWEGYLLTALVISGGSSFVRAQFNMIDTIPSIISSVTTTIKNMIVPGSSQQSESSNEIQTPVVTPISNYSDVGENSGKVTNVNDSTQDATRFSDNI